MTSSNNNGPSKFRPAGAYMYLPQGPRGSHTASSTSLPIAEDGTKKSLRDSRLGSPFTLRIQPPQMLLEALVGSASRGLDGTPKTSSAFDPYLRKVFEKAEDNYQVVLENYRVGKADFQDVENARNAMLVAQPSSSSQNINIIEAASRSKNNFSAVSSLKNAFMRSGFYAVGEGLPGLRNAQRYIDAHGVSINSNTNATNLNVNQLAVADLTQALDVIVQLNQIVNTPSLTLMVNPQNMRITHSKKQQYSARSRYGYLFESWGNGQDRISLSGTTGGFVVGSGEYQDFSSAALGSGDTTGGANPIQKTSRVSGYQWSSKAASASWQNFMSLLKIYRNNGYIYDRSGVSGGGPSEAHLYIGTVEITYDQWVYVGNFENFSYQYIETKQQGAVDFNCDFVASAVFDKTRGSQSPVTGYLKPPTSSPSSSNASQKPLIQDTSVRTARSTPPTEEGESTTCLLDPMCDPLGPNVTNTGLPGIVSPFSLGGRIR